jgi:hypothetical protein
MPARSYRSSTTPPIALLLPPTLELLPTSKLPRPKLDLLLPPPGASSTLPNPSLDPLLFVASTAAAAAIGDTLPPALPFPVFPAVGVLAVRLAMTLPLTVLVLLPVAVAVGSILLRRLVIADAGRVVRRALGLSSTGELSSSGMERVWDPEPGVVVVMLRREEDPGVARIVVFPPLPGVLGPPPACNVPAPGRLGSVCWAGDVLAGRPPYADAVVGETGTVEPRLRGLRMGIPD